MDYREFTASEAAEYVRTIPGLFQKSAALIGSDISDGNMNLVFRVYDSKNRENSVILKQALPYMRAVGPSWPLTSDRIRIEYETLSVQNKICPDWVPRIYHYDEKRALIIMEDLSSHHILRKGLMAQHRYPSLPKHIGTFLARSLFLTSDFGATYEERQKLKTQFQNKTMRRISEDFIFTYPFTDHEMNRSNPSIQSVLADIRNNDELQAEIAIIKQQFITNKQALIHGDLHTGSMMVTGNDTKVIDAEFAFYGPMGFDIGVLIAHLLMNSIFHEKEHHSAYKSYLSELIQGVWYEFAEAFRKQSGQSRHDAVILPNPNRFLSKLFQDALGFAGCEIMRRVMGTSHVEDLESIEEEDVRADAETLALFIGQHLILKRHHIQNSDELMASLKQLKNSSGQTL
ncbi:S-methyl-5-thioribose kinase [Tuberibacillus sp. Marseille-P3662]|uniref:S-methyl-5-thioribose kinase n=1 Tax=Tuberibacillus sp. Marseille-P3662 TaxID=1965358 RepID=UPI0015938395|nr:S-methyl-5-thioribose kinase [Tuberibacillus sp. Marseille-P3662]